MCADPTNDDNKDVVTLYQPTDGLTNKEELGTIQTGSPRLEQRNQTSCLRESVHCHEDTARRVPIINLETSPGERKYNADPTRSHAKDSTLSPILSWGVDHTTILCCRQPFRP